MRLIRRLVSKANRRFQEDGFDLDLAYVTDRIIAMGHPSEGGEGLFRNPMSETTEFLRRYHDGLFRVYNLCSEKTYDPAKLGGNVVRYPCEDLQAPPLLMIKRFCEDASAWLDASERNIAVVHCKAGRGRTGVLICCLLLWRRLCAKPEDVIRYYGDKRSTSGRGVAIASQLRYIHHFFDMFLAPGALEGCPPSPPQKRLRFSGLRILGLPKYLINGATVRLAARGRDDGSVCTEVFSVRTSGKKEWWCFGNLPPRRAGEVQIYVPGNEIVINRRTFRRGAAQRRAGHPALCWRGLHKAPGACCGAIDSSAEWSAGVRAQWDCMPGDGEPSEDGRGDADEPGPAPECSHGGCQGSDDQAGQGRDGGGESLPTDFVLDWDFTLQVFSSAAGGRECLFHTWENTSYVPDSGLLVLNRDQLDKVKGGVPRVVVEIRLRDADGGGQEDEEDDEDEGDVPSEWSSTASGLSQHNAPSESESQASTGSQSARRATRSYTSLGFGHVGWAWPSGGADSEAETELVARSSSRATQGSWQSLDAAWSQGWLGAPSFTGQEGQPAATGDKVPEGQLGEGRSSLIS
ncbi:unnamed protein product [Ostreobium quekettii]|uniref:phosphatidylinositol-3,4,5-trisphosphate 3-phosphatase n=1 Tax=Ostreobium quekettii TaxID=121088 RepID=A0A8S1JAH8_9CHLO|nr:unnamed protein product [Ostreobium quekettii]